MANFYGETEILVIKGRFRANATSSFGIFIIFLDSGTKQSVRIETIASHFSTILETNINGPWKNIVEMIMQMKFKGEYATSLTNDVQRAFEDMFTTGTGKGEDVWNDIKNSDYEAANQTFAYYISRPVSDKTVKFELAYEVLTNIQPEEIKRTSSSVSSDSGTGKADKKFEESGVLLEVAPVLGPVNGVSIIDLKEGQPVFVKITDSAKGEYFNTSLNAIDPAGQVLPVPATFNRVTKDGKFYQMYVTIGPGVYGKATTEDIIKVKLYDQQFDKRQKKEQQISKPMEPLRVRLEEQNEEDEKKKTESKMIVPANIIYIIIGIVFMAFILVMVVLFL